LLLTAVLLFAVQRAAAAPLLLGTRRLLDGVPAAGAPCSSRSIPRAASRYRWDRLTDGRTPYRYIDPASYYASRVNDGGITQQQTYI